MISAQAFGFWMGLRLVTINTSPTIFVNSFRVSPAPSESNKFFHLFFFSFLLCLKFHSCSWFSRSLFSFSPLLLSFLFISSLHCQHIWVHARSLTYSVTSFREEVIPYWVNNRSTSLLSTLPFSSKKINFFVYKNNRSFAFNFSNGNIYLSNFAYLALIEFYMQNSVCSLSDNSVPVNDRF